jgi:UDP-N-acetylglucosamine 2-epimerase (non-hydrolysing)
MTDILIPMGTRPEIIKLSPVIRALRDGGLAVRTVATGQHYDANLTDSFFAELGVAPDARWTLEGSESARLGQLVAAAEDEIATGRPDLVLILGDTNTVPVFCLAARRHQVPVAHLEAGMRSFNETSIEEVNRRIAAACASLHLAPTDLAARFLRAEGVSPERIHVVGNPIIDVLRASGLTAVPSSERSGVVVTAHRATNVDDPVRLQAIVTIVCALAETIGPVTLPVHPRTRRRLEEFGLTGQLASPHIQMIEPVGYSAMLSLVQRARLVVTDSGGLQEETAWFKVPTLVLRQSTPRWEGISAGFATLVGLDVQFVLDTAAAAVTAEAVARLETQDCPYGDGFTADRVARLLADPDLRRLIRPAEPDFVGKPVPA